jgi:hypothetical protein
MNITITTSALNAILAIFLGFVLGKVLLTLSLEACDRIVKWYRNSK